MQIQIPLFFKHDVDMVRLPEEIRAEIEKALADAFLAKLRSLQEKDECHA